jgi:hypothetical protein
MIPELLHKAMTSLKLCVADRDTYDSVAEAAQGDRLFWVASLELLSNLPSALHLASARARQEMVGSAMILS